MLCTFCNGEGRPALIGRQSPVPVLLREGDAQHPGHVDVGGNEPNHSDGGPHLGNRESARENLRAM